MQSSEKLLRELIALPSVNPAFLPTADSCAGEMRVAEFLAATAAQAGWDVGFQEVLPRRANLLARLQPAGRVRRRILLAPHLDTVGIAHKGEVWPRLTTKGQSAHGARPELGRHAVQAMARIVDRLETQFDPVRHE